MLTSVQISGLKSLTIGFLVGIAAFFLAQLMDSIAAGSGLPALPSFFPEYILAGVVFAVSSLPLLRALYGRPSDADAMTRRSVYASTIALATFIVSAFLVVPEISARWLIWFYALAVPIDRFAWRYFTPPSSTQVDSLSTRLSRFHTYLERTPHTPFIVVALCLLVAMPFLLLASQQFVVERMANWAYGFLGLGVALAALQFVTVPHHVRQWIRHFPRLAVVLWLVSFLVVGYYVGESNRVPPVVTYRTRVYPSYLDGRLTDGDILISDSPSLQLDAVAGSVAHLNVQPDQQGTELWGELIHSLTGKRRVFWISVPNASNDNDQFLATFLKTNGCLNDVPSTDLPIRLYELRTPLSQPRVLPPSLASRVEGTFDPVSADFGQIQISGTSFESKVCSHDAIAVSLRWHLILPNQTPLKVALFIFDNAGRQIQAQDFFISDALQRQTSQWKSNTQASSYYLMPVPFGTPPGIYTLVAGVYPADSSRRLRVNSASGVSAFSPDLIALGNLQVYRPDDLKADPYNTIRDAGLTTVNVALDDGLMLAAYGVDHQSVIPGENLTVSARWQALSDELPPSTAHLRLSRDAQVVTETIGTSLGETYPTDQWRAGESVVGHLDLRIPPATVGGPTRLEIGLNQGRLIYIADINVATITHTFEIPVISNNIRTAFKGVGDLIGYDLDRTKVSPNGSLGLALYWRAVARAWIDRDYVVFAQLLAANGNVIAQSDSAPANGERPTRGWVDGEIIVDRHALEFNDKTYQGEATLIVGLYDSVTLERTVLETNGANFVTLPTRIQVTGP